MARHSGDDTPRDWLEKLEPSAFLGCLAMKYSKDSEPRGMLDNEVDHREALMESLIVPGTSCTLTTRRRGPPCRMP
jgi:hypothetical protein